MARRPSLLAAFVDLGFVIACFTAGLMQTAIAAIVALIVLHGAWWAWSRRQRLLRENFGSLLSLTLLSLGLIAIGDGVAYIFGWNIGAVGPGALIGEPPFIPGQNSGR